MDWTGGVRRRFACKRKGSGVSQKQKAHFANVHATIPDTPKPQDGDSSSPDHDPQAAPLLGPSQVSVRKRHSNDRGSIASARSSALKQPKDRSMSDEEKLFMMHRRRLLAQTDWLGLRPKCPPRYDFSSSQEKDRIGKRRKIERAASEEHLFSPLFERRLPQHDLMMSGGLPPEKIRIRIGSGALDSDTQQSRHSEELARTSVRPMSVRCEWRSDEPMLPGADEDMFADHHMDSVVAVGGSHMTTDDAQAIDLPEDEVYRPDDKSSYSNLFGLDCDRNRQIQPTSGTRTSPTSLQQIIRLAEGPERPNAEEEADNALWREFIVGSQGSADSVDEHRLTRQECGDDTSDHATFGDTTEDAFK